MARQGSGAHRRRNYFIDKKFQSGFILRFCGLVLAAGLLTIGALYLLSLRSTTVSIVDSRVMVRSTADFLLPLLIQTVAVVAIIISLAAIILTMLASHKIAGPLYRFKKVLQSLEEGDFSSGFHIRRFDQLQDLSEAFNRMIGRLRQQQAAIKEHFVSLKEKVGGISEQDISEYKRAALNEMKKLADKLNDIINYFKT